MHIIIVIREILKIIFSQSVCPADVLRIPFQRIHPRNKVRVKLLAIPNEYFQLDSDYVTQLDIFVTVMSNDYNYHYSKCVSGFHFSGFISETKSGSVFVWKL